MSPWSSKEINDLRQHFINGLSIREMSLRLNRSPTAVNKSLTRFKIRQYKPQCKGRSLPIVESKNYTTPYINWHRSFDCDMDEVHDFVIQCMNSRLKFKDKVWVYHGSVISQRRAFILINMERVFRKFPPFYLDYGEED